MNTAWERWALCFVLTSFGVCACGRPSPIELGPKLTNLQNGFAEHSASADLLQKKSQQEIADLNGLRRAITTKLGSAPHEGLLLPGLDGLEIYLRSFSIEAGNNRNALNILESVTANILAGEKYNKLDESLQVLEQSTNTRDSNFKALLQHFDRVVEVIRSSRHHSEYQIVSPELDAIDALILLKRLHNGELLDEYEQNIKPGTEALRQVVDARAKGGG